jgi:hypothetical protein
VTSFSSALIKSVTSASHRVSRSSIDWRFASSAISAGSTDADGNAAFWTRTGITEPDEIVRVVQPTGAGDIGRREPLPADDREQNVAGTDGLVQDLGEVHAGLDVRDVHEHELGAEMGAQPVEEGSRVSRAVVAAVADEDPGHQESPSLLSSIAAGRKTVYGSGEKWIETGP